MRGAHELGLTPTEFRLLVYLARNGGRGMTRGQILEAVWGYDAEIEDAKKSAELEESIVEEIGRAHV